MDPTTRRSCPILLALFPASLVLASCGGLQAPHREQVASELTRAPTEPQELPTEQLTIELPKIPAPELPRIASRVRNATEPASKKNPAAPEPAKQTEPPVVTPTTLMGFDFSSVLRVLKQPDTVQSSALFIVWTYSRPDCTLQLYFYPDIQTKIFHLLKHDLKDGTGERIADENNCMRHMMVAKNDESPSR